MKRFVKLPRLLMGRARGLDLKHACLVLLIMAMIVCSSTAALAKTTYVITDGDESFVVSTFSESPEVAIHEAGVALGPDDGYETSADGSRVLVEVRRAVMIRVCSGDMDQVCFSDAPTVGETLTELGIFWDGDDQLNHDPQTPLEEGMVIRHVNVQTKYLTTTESIPYGLQYVEDSALFAGKSLGLVAGSNGRLSVTYRYVYEDGVLVRCQRCGTKVDQEPTNGLIAVGTRETPIDVAQMEYEFRSGRGIRLLTDYATYKPSVDNGVTVTTFTGEEYTYRDRIFCDATAYTYYEGGTNITASGLPAGVGVIASDWSVIPNGTLVYVVGVDGTWEYGYCIVGDNGAFSGPMVDLFMETYDQCCHFGARQAYVYIVG